jgi:hypothetical protein
MAATDLTVIFPNLMPGPSPFSAAMPARRLACCASSERNVG